MTGFIERRRLLIRELAEVAAHWERIVGARDPAWDAHAVPFTAEEDAANRALDAAIDRYLALRSDELRPARELRDRF